MSESNIEFPDFYDISEEAIQTVDAALDPTPRPPDDATVSKNARTGDEYLRWSEAMLIDEIKSTRSPKGHTVILVRGKIKALGAPTKNIGKRVWSRYVISFPVLLGQVNDPGLESMNVRSITAIKSLLMATGFWPSSNRLTAALLQKLFPKDGIPPSDLLGKVVIANLCDSPNTGDGAKRPRDVKAESYLKASNA